MEITKCKRIWITTIWDVSPVLQKGANYGRMFAAGEYFAKQGYDVTIWFTTFDHPSKKHLYDKDTVVQVSENEKIVLIHSPVTYKRNMSPTRFIYDELQASRMARYMRDEERFPAPDVIFCSYPTEQYCRAALKYGKKHNIPVIVDIRDHWPDIFDRALPNCLKPFAAPILFPLKRRTARVVKNAAAICGTSPINIDWALRYAKRERMHLDRDIFIGVDRHEVTAMIKERELEKWRRLDVTDETWNICLFSSLSSTSLDTDTLINAVRIVHDKYDKVRLIIGGKGDDEERLRRLTMKLDYIHMPGWMDSDEMASLMSISKVGMLCYRNTKDFRDGWGNKVGQYMSYALPILTSASGMAKTYLEKWNCGLYYHENQEEELADMLLGLIGNPRFLRTLSDNASKQFLVDFEKNKVAQQMELMINDVYATNRTPL